jgi:hypothetical protein
VPTALGGFFAFRKSAPKSKARPHTTTRKGSSPKNDRDHDRDGNSSINNDITQQSADFASVGSMMTKFGKFNKKKTQAMVVEDADPPEDFQGVVIATPDFVR